MARIDMGLTEREFWEMTPAQFALLHKRHRENIRQQAAMHGIEIKAEPEPTGMGPEVFRAFEKAFTEG